MLSKLYQTIFHNFLISIWPQAARSIYDSLFSHRKAQNLAPSSFTSKSISIQNQKPIQFDPFLLIVPQDQGHIFPSRQPHSDPWLALRKPAKLSVLQQLQELNIKASQEPPMKMCSTTPRQTTPKGSNVAKWRRLFRRRVIRKSSQLSEAATRSLPNEDNSHDFQVETLEAPRDCPYFDFSFISE